MPNGSEGPVDVGAVVREYSRRVLDEFRESSAKLRPAPREKRKQDEASTENRDDAVRRFLSERLPSRYGVDGGVIIDTHGGQTKPFGAVVYDRERLPVLRGENDVSVWPFESVYAAVEVRPRLTREDLEAAVQNIAAFKRLEREKMTTASATGFTVSGEIANPAFGTLVAYEHSEDLVPSEAAFDELVKSVPREQQLDAYCVVSGPVGCLGREVPMMGLLLGFSNQGPTKIYHFTFHDGALAAFLLMVTGILNKIRLGEPALVHYLRSASP